VRGRLLVALDVEHLLRGDADAGDDDPDDHLDDVIEHEHGVHDDDHADHADDADASQHVPQHDEHDDDAAWSDARAAGDGAVSSQRRAVKRADLG